MYVGLLAYKNSLQIQVQYYTSTSRPKPTIQVEVHVQLTFILYNNTIIII